MKDVVTPMDNMMVVESFFLINYVRRLDKVVDQLAKGRPLKAVMRRG